ncbi:MAG: DNA-protecting protein DprA [Proteobacteria bacterium]|nr:DNA-protecting protein DprA [Pseudomonadota bacterium]
MSFLIKHFGGINAIFQANEKDLTACGLKSEVIRQLRQPDAKLIKSQLLWSQQPNQHIITLEHEIYPSILKTIPDPPPVLFIKGDPLVLSSPQLAMVGSRRPSPGGLKVAMELAAALSRCGLIITSGLANGIDGACHRGALSVTGKTVAVLGCGLNRTYPPSHRVLADQIVQNGALISEFPPDTAPLAGYFPRRNRIISGISQGVCVIEAGLSSGSLITAALALEQAREVFAVPGSILNPMTRGCHYLIQQGAKLVTCVEDILSELKHGSNQWCIIPSNHQPVELDSHCHQLLQCVGFESTPMDLLVQRSGFSIAQVTEWMVTLELNGYVSSSPGGYHRLL